MNNEEKYLQNESHDLLGEAAEFYVRYIFAREGFEVFGGAKWGVDCALHDVDTHSWWRVEVRSTDRRTGRPIMKPPAKLKGKAELVAEVIARDGCMGVTLLRVNEKGEYYNTPKYETSCARENDVMRFFVRDEKNGTRQALKKFITSSIAPHC